MRGSAGRRGHRGSAPESGRARAGVWAAARLALRCALSSIEKAWRRLLKAWAISSHEKYLSGMTGGELRPTNNMAGIEKPLKALRESTRA